MGSFPRGIVLPLFLEQVKKLRIREGKYFSAPNLVGLGAVSADPPKHKCSSNLVSCQWAAGGWAHLGMSDSCLPGPAFSSHPAGARGLLTGPVVI